MKEKSQKPRTNINIESLFIGEEPTFGNPKTEIGVCRSLSWYSNQYGPKESKKYTIEYAKDNQYSKDIVSKLNSADEELFKNLGFVCRMVSRGANIGIDKFNWIESRINAVIDYKADSFTSALSVQQTLKPEKSIQDKIFEYATQYINEIEGHIDTFIKSHTSEFKCYDWLKSNSIKPIYIIQIKQHYNPLLEELSDAINKKDDQLVESYSHWSKKDLKSFFEFVTGIIADCEKYTGNVKTIRKPRKQKSVPLEKKVASVKYQKESVEYKIASISPTQILGAQQLWVFNTKYKKLGVYFAKDEAGLGIKGTTIEGFDETSSICKTLRKPEEVLPTVAKGKKTDLKKVMSTIKCKETQLTGRISSDTILLKTV
jgi:hypothetical protein